MFGAEHYANRTTIGTSSNDQVGLIHHFKVKTQLESYLLHTKKLMTRIITLKLRNSQSGVVPFCATSRIWIWTTRLLYHRLARKSWKWEAGLIILLTDKLTVNSNSVFVEITNTSRAEKEKKKKSCLNCGSIVVRVISLIKTDCLQASGKVEERHVVRSAGISS